MYHVQWCNHAPRTDLRETPLVNWKRFALALSTHCLKVGRFFGIDVRIHISFWALPILFGLTSLSLGWLDALLWVAAVLVVYVFLLIHEYGHALTARLFGVNTRDI